ncbi:DEKNAAE104573 [Brettanomyces naardenensis]|uniref:DEKNAAE104574 n=1 Tax=Brettanomyces naardenensis TaxID=13370 RepID=A0A448YRQ8_BRENA|nr:DEKNAAE104573 [Brettanomyces naardenensis]
MAFWGGKSSEDSSKEGKDDLSKVPDSVVKNDGSLDEKSIESHQENRSTKQMRDLAKSRGESLNSKQFPKDMSCLTAMDELLECMSLGGQVRNYYRYGDFTMCTKQSEKLHFCMKNSAKPQEQKENNIREFYKSRVMESLKRGSSEDIWEARK